MSGASSDATEAETGAAAPEVLVRGRATPTEEEAAAIAAAVQLVLSSGGSTPEVAPEGPPRWRFSGRWWSKPIPTRRERPSAF